MKKIAAIFGTRPDTIKMAPVILELKKHKDTFQVLAIATAQHRQMLDQVLNVFNLTPDYDLNLMEPQQTLARLTSKIILSLDEVFSKEKPDMVIVQGDTTTTFAGSLAAFYHRIPVAHVEAGLRTYDKWNPFPEEINRRLTSCITDLHFAPTETARKALLDEGFPSSSVYVTGNSVVDALDYSVKKNYSPSTETLKNILSSQQKIVLITMHRRENWGEPMAGAARAIKKLARQFRHLQFVFPVHLNPVVRNTIYPILKDEKNIFLIEPLDYYDFVNLMARSYLILTDSGGVQEEGPHFGIPILVLRSVTERPDAVTFGTVKLVGLDEENIYQAAATLIQDASEYRKMANAVNPYGDGKTSQRIVQIIKNYFKLSNEKIDEFKPSAGQKSGAV